MDFIWYRMNWNLLAPETERMWHSLEKKPGMPLLQWKTGILTIKPSNRTQFSGKIQKLINSSFRQ